MDVEMRRWLGRTMVGALVLIAGLLALLIDAAAPKILGGIAVWAGGLMVAIGVATMGLRLIRD